MITIRIRNSTKLSSSGEYSMQSSRLYCVRSPPRLVISETRGSSTQKETTEEMSTVYTRADTCTAGPDKLKFPQLPHLGLSKYFTTLLSGDLVSSCFDKERETT